MASASLLPNILSLIGMYPPKASQESGFFEKPVGGGPYKFVSFTTVANCTVRDRVQNYEPRSDYYVLALGVSLK